MGSERTDITPVAIDPRYHDAVLFDLDGVIIDTAAPHAAAWQELFDGYLSGRASSPAEHHGPFTAEDYRHFIDGKPRYDGVRDFLASRGVTLPWGANADGPDLETGPRSGQPQTGAVPGEGRCRRAGVRIHRVAGAAAA